MTRKEDREASSFVRSVEYRRKRKRNAIILVIAIVLYVGIPLLWYGAIEFGYAHPIQTQEFKSALSLASLVVLLVLVGAYTKHYDYERQEKKQTQKIEQPTSPQTSA